MSVLSYLSVALLCMVGASAAPARVEERAISSDLLATFNLIEQYAAAAYCPDNNDSPDTAITCSSGNCPLVESAAAESVYEFENSLITDVTGYVAVDSTNSLIVVSFRGSESLRNFLADISITKTDTDLCSDCSAVNGFWTSWVEARDGVLKAVEEASDANPGYKVVATGHSLGGAIADLAAAQLRNEGYDTSLYTFGAPRIAGSTLSSYITNQSGGNYRITHYNDPVPRLPPIALGFVHISPEYYISTENYVPVTADAIEVYEGSINYNGNTAWVITDIAAHGWYFNNISACYPDDLVELKRRGNLKMKFF